MIGLKSALFVHQFRKGCLKNDTLRDKGLIFPNDIVAFRNEQYGPDSKSNILDLYIPTNISGKLPVLVSVHGGGYIGSVRNKYYVFAKMYCDMTDGFSVVTPDYRVGPENKHPAALSDALDAYQWILSLGFSSNKIILAGDSAGGGLCMALAMYLRDHHFPMPRAIIAMSPWTDVTASGESYKSNFEKDILFGNTHDSMIFNNPYFSGRAKADPYVSPLFGNFEGMPPMLIQVGSDEMLLSDSLGAAEKAKAAGVPVKLTVYEGMFHVFQMCYQMIPESKAAWEEVEQYLQRMQ